MSISALLQPNELKLYSNSLDNASSSLLLGYNVTPRIDIGQTGTAVYINEQLYIPGGGSEPVTPQTLAYFAAGTSASIDSTSIVVNGTENSLLFPPGGAIECNTIVTQSIDALTGSLLLGYNTAPRIDVGATGTSVYINGSLYTSVSTPVTANTIGYFSGTTSGSITSTNITTDVAQNALVFPPSTGFINCDFLDSANSGANQLSLGSETNNTVSISQPGQLTLIQGDGQVNGTFTSNSLQSSNAQLNINATGAGNSAILDAFQDVVIGPTNTQSIDIGHPGIPVNIYPGATLMVSNIDSTNPPIVVYPTPSLVTFGATGGNLALNSSLTLPNSDASLSSYYSDINLAVVGSGCITAQTVGKWHLLRVGDMVTISFIWTAGFLSVAGTSPLFLSNLPTPYIPVSNYILPMLSSVDGMSYAMGDAICQISGGSGAISISPIGTALSGGFQFGQFCALASMALSFSVTL